jgi:hypothetical protein
MVSIAKGEKSFVKATTTERNQVLLRVSWRKNVRQEIIQLTPDVNKHTWAQGTWELC